MKLLLSLALAATLAPAAAAAPAAHAYSCLVEFDNPRVQAGPLYNETFDVAATDSQADKTIPSAFTVPRANLVASFAREANDAGARINLSIDNLDTNGSAVAQFADGDPSIQVLYSTGGGDTVRLGCAVK